MAYISNEFHKRKLNDNNINIKTKYIVDNNILETNSNNSYNDNILNGVRCQKIYYVNNELKQIENDFDTRIEYTFIKNKDEDKIITCPNCGMESNLKNFIDGCPYCKTSYNIDYQDKELGNKKHYDQVLRSSKYRIITAIIDIIISLLISLIFIKLTSRTFNTVDIFKVFIYGAILSFILYYIFYLLDAYVVLLPIKMYKEKQNKKQILFWNESGIDKNKFFNNFNYEISKYYYSKTNIIDYDILDYISFKQLFKNNKNYIEVEVLIRLMEYKNNEFIKTIKPEKYLLFKNDANILELKDGINIVKCHNCGSSIDVNKGYCEYCKSEIKYLQEWILDKK